MNGSADLLVVGGGIAGLTSALCAARRGLRVILCDDDRGGAASRVAAGLLAPSVDGLPPAVRAFAMAARDHYPAFLAELLERTGIHVPLNRSGILQVAVSGQELDAPAALNPSAQRLDPRALTRLEPSLAAHAGGVLHPHDGDVDTVVLMEALRQAVASAPSIQSVGGRVSSLDLQGSRPNARTASGDTLEATTVLLASGAWAGALPGLPRSIPVRPLGGQVARLDAQPLRHVVFTGSGYLVPRGATLLVGATSEDTGFDSVTTPQGLDTLRAIAVGAVPPLEGARVLAHHAGLRPMTPDGLPILGADPACPALVYACGFSRNGILLAPWAAGQIAPLLAGEPAPGSLAAFSVSRFARA